MRRIRIGIYMLLAAGMIALWGSCQRDDSPAGETAEVTLRFATRAGGDGTGTANDPNATEEEGIKTLRIIVRDEIAGEIVRNEKRTFGTETQPLLEKEVKVYDLPLSTYTFYLIANEESIGMTYTNENLQFTEVDGVKKILFVDEGNEYFPQTAGNIPNGLPMAAKSDPIAISKENHSLSMTLERAVSKVKVNIANLTGKEIVVNKLLFGNFIADRLYLFRKEVLLDIPEGTQYGAFVLGEDKPLGVHVEPGGTGEVIWYTYPSFAWTSGENSPYTLGIVTEGNNEGYSPRQFLDGSGQALNSLQRNVQLNINASISAEAQLIINFEVTQWKGETIEVPPFD